MLTRAASRFARRSRSALVLALIMLGSASCGRTSDTPDADQTLTIHLPNGDEHALGPAGNLSWFLVFPGLTGDPGGESLDERGDPPGLLLDRWEHTPDYREWILHVRDGVRWEDGAPVTAEDVKFSLELWTNKDIGYEYAFFDTLEVRDPQTLRVTFSEPVSATVFTYSWLAMVPKHILESLPIAELFDWPFWVQPVGAGPFRYVRHIPDVMTELAVNPDYYGEQPRIPRVVLRYGGNPVTELLSGNVDITSPVSPLDAIRLGTDSRFTVYHRVGYQQTTAIAWNHRRPMFQDKRVRRALTMAIDRRQLHRVLNYPDDVAIFDVPTLDRHHRQGMAPEAVAHDSAAAARLLAEAGWVDTNGDGVLDRDGRPFEFTLSVTQDEAAQAVYVQDQFRRVGIRVDISTFGPGSQMRRRITSTGDFDAAIVRYNYVEQFDTFPITGYRNPTLSSLRDSVWFGIEHAKLDGFVRELWRIFADEMPVTFLHPSVNYFVASRRVQGLTNGVELFSTVQRLWIDDRQQ